MSAQDNFWERCVQHGVVIVPFKLYTDYGTDGNFHEIDLIGIRFIGMENPAETRLNDVSLGFETSIGSPLKDGTDLVGMTPEEAFDKYIAWQGKVTAQTSGYQTSATLAVVAPKSTE